MVPRRAERTAGRAGPGRVRCGQLPCPAAARCGRTEALSGAPVRTLLAWRAGSAPCAAPLLQSRCGSACIRPTPLAVALDRAAGGAVGAARDACAGRVARAGAEVGTGPRWPLRGLHDPGPAQRCSAGGRRHRGSRERRRPQRPRQPRRRRSGRAVRVLCVGRILRRVAAGQPGGAGACARSRPRRARLRRAPGRCRSADRGAAARAPGPLLNDPAAGTHAARDLHRAAQRRAPWPRWRCPACVRACRPPRQPGPD